MLGYAVLGAMLDPITIVAMLAAGGLLRRWWQIPIAAAALALATSLALRLLEGDGRIPTVAPIGALIDGMLFWWLARWDRRRRGKA